MVIETHHENFYFFLLLKKKGDIDFETIDQLQ